MIKYSSTITPRAIDRAIRRLSMSEKIRLFRTLRKETWAKRLGDIMKTADQNRRKHGISTAAIKREVEKASREYYQSRH